MMKSILKNISVERIALALFGSMSLLFFGLFYNHHLWQREQVQLLELTPVHFMEVISVQGGFSVFAGELLTQFFHIRVIAAMLVTFLLILLHLAVRKLIISVWHTRRLIIISWLPSLICAILLTSQFYYVSGLAGLIIAVAGSVWHVRKTMDDRVLHRIIKGVLLLVVVWWLAGGAFLSCTLVLIISEIVRAYENSELKPLKTALIACSVYLVAAVALPLLARTFLISDTLLQAYLSEAYYAVRIFFPLSLALAFASVPLVLLLYRFLPPAVTALTEMKAGLVLVFILTVITAAGIFYFADFGEEREMAYENYVYSGRWDKIISMAEKDQPITGVQKAALNLALGMTGRLSTDMFHFRQDKNALFVPYVRRGMTPFIAGETHYNLGLYNFSQMFAMETIESTVDARLPSRAVRRVAETYLLNGQTDIACKFYTLLSHTLFYRKEARHFLGLISDTAKMKDDPYLSQMRALMPDHDFFYDQSRMDYALTSLVVSNPANRMAFEYLMAHYLLNKDLDGFLRNISLINQLGYDGIPIPYQEAVAYILTRLEDPPEALRSLVYDQSVIENLRAYANAYNNRGSDTLKMEREFGQTYWFYLHYR
ncbi:MAG TPA: hypothetical protein DCY25_02465 [Bacteroidales bacterium]|nr:hypothetical protein [Bacteroidales bacterium]